MSRKKKYPTAWMRQWFLITTYNPIGFFKRRKFFVVATTHNTAERKLLKAHPDAKTLCIAPLGANHDQR